MPVLEMSKRVVLTKETTITIKTSPETIESPYTYNEAGQSPQEIILEGIERMEQWRLGRCYFHPEKKECPPYTIHEYKLIPQCCQQCLLCRLLLERYAHN